jgi:hypothetical protein
MRGVLVLLVASGCRSLLGFEELGDPAVPGDGAPQPDGAASDGPIVDAPPVDSAVACPANYTLTIASSTSSYRFVGNQAIPWLTANSRCTDDGTHMIVLSSAAELNEINLAAGAGNRWVGLSDRRVDNTFVPVTDENTAFPPSSGAPWAAGEPSDSGNDCVAMNDNGDLITLACGNGFNFVCECDGLPSDPNNF